MNQKPRAATPIGQVLPIDCDQRSPVSSAAKVQHTCPMMYEEFPCGVLWQVSSNCVLDLGWWVCRCLAVARHLHVRCVVPHDSPSLEPQHDLFNDLRRGFQGFVVTGAASWRAGDTQQARKARKKKSMHRTIDSVANRKYIEISPSVESL
jgi:hypothetical protein